MNGNRKTTVKQQNRVARTASWLVCTAMAGHATIASGQQLLEPGQLPGELNELQRPVGNAVFKVCANLVNGLRVSPLANNTPTERLAHSCSKMVTTAFKGAPPRNPALNLGLSGSEFGTAVQALAPVQANAQKQIGTEAAKMNAIGTRLLNVRRGARGMMLGMNSLDIHQPGATGGGAAADDVLGGKWGGFANVTYNWGDIDKTVLQDAYKQDSYNVLAGADYRVSDAFVLGGAISYSDTKAKYERGLGHVDAVTTGAIGYGSFYADDWYLDGLIAYGKVDYDSARNIVIASNTPGVQGINATATSSPEGKQWSASFGGGKEMRFGTLTFIPSARLNYIRVNNKAFAENEPIAGLGLAVNARTNKSLQTAIGVKLSSTVNTASAVLLPYVSAQWLHEFEKDSPLLTSRYVNDPNGLSFSIATQNPTRDYGIVSLGTSMTFANNVAAFAQFSTAVGLKDESNYAVSAGVRLQF